jgi:hypothetical protein
LSSPPRALNQRGYEQQSVGPNNHRTGAVDDETTGVRQPIGWTADRLQVFLHFDGLTSEVFVEPDARAASTSAFFLTAKWRSGIIFAGLYWGVAKWQGTGFWSRDRRFESCRPSRLKIRAIGVVQVNV